MQVALRAGICYNRVDMADFAASMASGHSLTVEEQKKAGAPVAGNMDEGHRSFLKTIKTLIESGEIDPYVPKTFVKAEVYDEMPEEWQDKTDLTLQNMAGLLKQIYDLYISKQTPDEAPQYQTMIEHLWQMKKRVEEQYDVFKF